MSSRTWQIPEGVHQWLLAETVDEPDVCRRLREETASLEWARMQISPEQGAFLMLLVQMLGAQKVLEIGTFTGYSALCMALALPADGRLVACDVSAEWTAMGQRYWREAGVEGQIDLRLAPALETLSGLRAEGADGFFDLVFIDADKANYPAYYDAAVSLLRPGGVVAVDNALWSGAVADPTETDPSTTAIRATIRAARSDPRTTGMLLPIGDGLLLARKNG